MTPIKACFPSLVLVLMLVVCITSTPFGSADEAEKYWQTLSLANVDVKHVRLWQAMVILGTNTPESRSSVQFYRDSMHNAKIYSQVESVRTHAHYPFVKQALKVIMKAAMKEKTLAP